MRVTVSLKTKIKFLESVLSFMLEGRLMLCKHSHEDDVCAFAQCVRHLCAEVFSISLYSKCNDALPFYFYIEMDTLVIVGTSLVLNI